jgi:hypothetical protein
MPVPDDGLAEDFSGAGLAVEEALLQSRPRHRPAVAGGVTRPVPGPAR